MGSTYFTKRIKAMLGQKAKGRKKRPRTFASEAAAKAYAEKHGMKNYEIVNLKYSTSKSKKIRLINMRGCLQMLT